MGYGSEDEQVVYEDTLSADQDQELQLQQTGYGRSDSAPVLGTSTSASWQDRAKKLNFVRKQKARPIGVGRRKPLSASDNWDERHHLMGAENENKPKGLREYFSKPTTLSELKMELKQIKNSKSCLQKLEAEEVPVAPPSFLSADNGPSVCPERHIRSGTMLNADNELRPWNDRWHAGMCITNEGLHPLHRTAFGKQSLFETAPSQRWRRHVDVQGEQNGLWLPIKTRRPERFPPLGV
mmetsp:Transcript_63932/g.113683  ORF Transcript_63932/g.113683 Transcript_63932/m.113683 type:complete len:238 (+) Transcript_63932:89-802(+)|eukprot:CAMPEP_0197651472 /NCGR_PEP_ID=MMETSP1338-20131121/32672_1 /TAXON_ID=43686 ORGANISM="Pelagodinium beii, Strain RCC1491" /NCGR_SAMPLE_ID=MMETSP1338 /ASSEMBLY_ACC=CAM_ASM_000754 /LENGTH=237 /DNA_ID=CAMNT_0043226113 /DNA_START=64 /DNA_END=777 /DNA_ORIENTATION=+